MALLVHLDQHKGLQLEPKKKKSLWRTVLGCRGLGKGKWDDRGRKIKKKKKKEKEEEEEEEELKSYKLEFREF